MRHHRSSILVSVWFRRRSYPTELSLKLGSLAGGVMNCFCCQSHRRTHPEQTMHRVEKRRQDKERLSNSIRVYRVGALNPGIKKSGWFGLCLKKIVLGIYGMHFVWHQIMKSDIHVWCSVMEFKSEVVLMTKPSMEIPSSKFKNIIPKKKRRSRYRYAL